MAEPKRYKMADAQLTLWVHWDSIGYLCPYTKSGKWMDIVEDAQIEENKPSNYIFREHGWE